MTKQFIRVLTLLSLTVALMTCSENQNERPELTFDTKSHIFNKSLSAEMIRYFAKNNYEKRCYKFEFYFCPPLDEVWQMQVTTDVCKDPPEIISISECFEIFECDPSTPDLGDVDCTTDDGYPGTQKKICDKGKIKYTDCTSVCSEEICD